MTRAVWTPKAVADLDDADLDDIVDYIAAQAGRKAVSRKIYAGIKSLCDKYAGYFADGNVLGTHCPEMGEGIRLVTYQRWVILFRPIEQSIEVLNIFDGSRDYVKVFGESSD